MEKNYFTIAETAALLRISPATARRMYDAGVLTGFRIPGGNHRRIARVSIEHFLRAAQAPRQEV